MFSFLNNIPQVTKNLLIINVMLFIITIIFEQQGINLQQILGAHYVNSPLFEPYQIVTHFFMHANIAHIAFNMFALVTFGGFLERLWGGKRFFILFIASAIGAFALYNAMGVYQIYELKQQITAYGVDINQVNDFMLHPDKQIYGDPRSFSLIKKYMEMCGTPMVGASGGVFGVLAAFVILFPNTQLMLLFFPMPIKAKYLIGGYILLELVLSFQQIEGDTTAHLAHVGGAIVGAIFVLVWRKNKTHFY